MDAGMEMRRRVWEQGRREGGGGRGDVKCRSA